MGITMLDRYLTPKESALAIDRHIRWLNGRMPSDIYKERERLSIEGPLVDFCKRTPENVSRQARKRRDFK